VQIREPLRVQYRGYEILTNPPPSSGGILIAFALKLLEAVDFSQIEWGSDRHWLLLAQTMALTNLAREQQYDRALYDPEIAQNLFSASVFNPYQLQLTQLSNLPNKWGSTTHISTLDREGNAASITNSNGEGSAYILENTGIMLNNMLGEADLNPLGFHQWPCDRRLSSMMAPTIILKEGTPAIVLGSGGSNRIRSAILQVISNRFIKVA
jgi:gamma-glutamyltranspeptidase/glutathione hydrolase